LEGDIFTIPKTAASELAVGSYAYILTYYPMGVENDEVLSSVTVILKVLDSTHQHS